MNALGEDTCVSCREIPGGSAAARIRMTLRDRVPADLESGNLVEIDLLGDGLPGYYTRLLINPPMSDADGVLIAVELLRRSIAELDLRKERGLLFSPEDTEFWTSLVRRIARAEDLVDRHEADGSSSLVWLLDQVRTRLLMLLRDNIRNEAVWKSLNETLALALDRCLGLAEDAKAKILENTNFGQVAYEPLATGPEHLSYDEAFAQGLHLAGRLGLDLNTLKVGLCDGSEVAVSLRGRVL